MEKIPHAEIQMHIVWKRVWNKKVQTWIERTSRGKRLVERNIVKKYPKYFIKSYREKLLRFGEKEKKDANHNKTEQGKGK